MKKKLISLLTAILLVSSSSVLGFADDTKQTYDADTKTFYVEIDGKTVASHLSLDDNEYGEPSADPTPQNDQNAISGVRSGAVVTDSDVQRYQVDWSDPDYGGEYYAHGYVTMKIGNQNAYHYSRAEIWYNGSSVVAATPHYGYGKVYSTSPCTPRKGTARIFYGE